MKKQAFIKSLILVFLLSLTQGCGAIAFGRSEAGDDAVVGRIRLGHSTKADVSKLLGEPDSLTKLSSGTEVWTYGYFRKRIVFLNYSEVPLSGDESQDRDVMIEFSKRGVVSRVEKNPLRLKSSMRFGG